MDSKTGGNKLVSKNKTSLKTGTVKSIKIFKGNANNIVIRDLSTNRVIGPKTLSNKRDGAGGSALSGLASGLKSRANNGIDKLANKRVLKTVNLDKEPDINIGANVIKSGYNDVVKVKRTAEVTVKTAKVIKNVPRNIKRITTGVRKIPTKVREIPNRIKTTKDQMKKAAITSAKEISDIKTKISKGNFKGASKQAGKNLVNGSKKTYNVGKKSVKTARKIMKPTFKVANVFGKIGLKEFENNLKRPIKSKEDETDDLGSNVVSNLADGGKNSVIITAKGIRSVRNLNRRVNSVKSKLKTSTSINSKIKTISKSNKLNSMINQPAFKAASAARKQAVKLAQYAIDAVKTFVMSIMRAIASNPIALGITAFVIVIIVTLQLLLSVFMGVHGALTIDFGDNIDDWKTQMARIDKSTNQRIHSGDSLQVINRSYNTTWKDVLAVYYVKYGDMKLSKDGNVSNGPSTNSINPELWNNIYQVLQAQLGKNYEFGADGPDTFDCSGLVEYIYNQFSDKTGITMKRSTYEQCEQGEEVDSSNQSTWQPGDLVFFIGDDSQNGLPGHVGIYIGNDEYIQAPSTGDVVKISNISDRSDLWGVRRIISDSSGSTSTSSGQNNSSSNDGSSLYQSINGTYADLFTEVGKEYGVDPILLASIAMQESGLDPNAVSSAGALGLCQFMPDTFTSLGFDQSEIFDPYTNASACAIYIKQLLDATGGDLTAALQCYNLGPNAYKSYGGDVSKMPAETQAYAGAVYNWYEQFSNGGLPSGAVSSNTNASNSVSSKLKEVYDLFNTVTSKTYTIHHDDGSEETRVEYTLTKHTIEEVEDKLNMNADDKYEVEGILEYDNFDDLGEDYDFRFQLSI